MNCSGNVEICPPTLHFSSITTFCILLLMSSSLLKKPHSFAGHRCTHSVCNQKFRDCWPELDQTHRCGRDMRPAGSSTTGFREGHQAEKAGPILLRVL